MGKTHHIPFPLLGLLILLVTAGSACSAPDSRPMDSESPDGPVAEPKASISMEVDAKEGSAIPKVMDTETMPKAASEPTGTDFIGLGQTVTGVLSSYDNALTDGSYYDDWILEIPRSGTIAIDMVSETVDSYVMLMRGWRGGPVWDGIASDDDGGSGLDAFLTASVQPGTYTITANSYDSGDLGRYWLSLGWR